MRNTLVGFLLAALLMGFSSAAMAIEGVTLEQALSMALKNNNQAKALQGSLEAARAEARSARSHMLPKVTVEERFMRTDNPTYAFSSKLNQGQFTMADFDINALNNPDDVDDFQTSINFEMPLYAPEAYIGARMAATRADARALDVERARQGIALNVTNAYYNVISSRRLVEAAHKGLEDAREHHRVTVARAESGLGLRSDTLRAEVSVMEAQERLLKAEKGVELSRRMLGLLIGLDTPVDAVADTREDAPHEIGFYLDASSSRPDIMAMQKNIENASNNVSLKRTKYAPVAGLGAGYQVNSPDAPFESEGDSYSVMAFVRWDIYDGGGRSAELIGARASLREAGEYFEGMKKEVAYRVHEAYLSLNEASQGHELALARVSLAEETVRLVATRYENSLATVVELLDAQSALNAARAESVMKKNEYLLAFAALKFQSGLIAVPGGQEK